MQIVFTAIYAAQILLLSYSFEMLRVYAISLITQVVDNTSLRMVSWDLFQIGITNNRDQRTQKHQSRKWTLIDIRGPMDGTLCKSLERSIIIALKRRHALFASSTDHKKFDGWTEAWTRDSFHANTIKELMEIVYEDDDSTKI